MISVYLVVLVKRSKTWQWDLLPFMRIVIYMAIDKLKAD